MAKEQDKAEAVRAAREFLAANGAAPGYIIKDQLTPDQRLRLEAMAQAVASTAQGRPAVMSEVMARAAVIEKFLLGGAPAQELSLAEGVAAFETRDREDVAWPEHPALHPIWQDGVCWALGRVGNALGVKNWDRDAATETIEGDVSHEITSIFTTAKLYDPETDTWATLPAAETP